DKGVLPKTLERTLSPTYLASAFRSIRFGIAEAHGRGIAVQLNYLLDAGAFTANADGTFSVKRAKAKAMGERLGTVRPVVQKALDRLNAIPVDIEPRFTTAAQLTSSAK